MPRTAAELGQTGLPLFAGRLSIDTNTRLRWPYAGRIYRQMLNDEPACAALWTAVRTLLRTDVQVSGDDQQQVELIESSLDDMRDSLSTKLKQMASSFFYGFDIHEMVYKRRDDGLVGWADWAIRRQETFERWETDKNGRVSGFTQRPAPSYKLITIPLKKCIHTIADDSDGSPEGRGALRPIYRYWYMVTQFELLGGIGLERGVGFPVIKRTDNPPIQLTPEQEDDIGAQAEAIRQNEQAYIILPPGMDFTFAAMPGVEATSYLSFIQSYRTWMLSTALAEFIALGTGDTGSFALGKSKIDLFLKALTGFQDKLCDTLNRQAIPQLCRYNGWMDQQTWPTVSLPAVREYDLTMLGGFAKVLSDIGAFHPQPADEEWFRKISDLVDIPLDELETIHADANAAADAAKQAQLDALKQSQAAQADALKQSQAAQADAPDMQDTPAYTNGTTQEDMADMATMDA